MDSRICADEAEHAIVEESRFVLLLPGHPPISLQRHSKPPRTMCVTHPKASESEKSRRSEPRSFDIACQIAAKVAPSVYRLLELKESTRVGCF
jgi:hypothetical protein